MKRQLISYLLAAAAAAAALIACTREPETQPEVYDQETEYEVVLTASLAPDTRGVSVTSDAVTATWSADDKVALVYNNKILTALEVTGISGNSAQLSGKVYGAYPTNTAMTLYYGGVNADFTGISYDYSGQDGTAASAAARAYLQADVKIAKQENKKLTLGDATTGGAITLAHQQAYYELNFQYGPDVLKVRSVEVTGSTGIVKNRTLTDNGFSGENYAGDADDHFTVTTTAAEGFSTVYFVFSDITTPPTSDGFDYDFLVTDVNGNTYSAEWKLKDGKAVNLELDKRGPAVNGTYKSGTWVLDRKTLDPTKPQAQSVVYDAQPHELVTPGAVPYGEGLAEGAVLMYYFAKSGKPVDPVNPVLEASDTSALTPGDNAVWSTEIPVATEPGHYCVWYKVVGGRYFNDVPPTPVVEIDPDNDPNTLNAALIDKRSLTVTAPTGIANLKYTGSAQALVNAGTIKDKTSEEFDPGLAMQYCVFEGENPPMDLNNAAWITEVPQAVNAGKYHIWYKVDSTAHYHGLAPADSPITVTIQTVDAVISNPVSIENLVYNGAEQEITLPADASDGCTVYYYVTDSATEVPTADADYWVAAEPGVGPKKKNAGTYYVWTKTVQSGSNYTGLPANGGVSAGYVVGSIAKAELTVVNPTPLALVYNGADRILVGTAENTTHPDGSVTYTTKNNQQASALEGNDFNATLSYMVTDNDTYPVSWSTATTWPAYPAKRKNAGTYYIWQKIDGGRNFKDKIISTCVSATIAPADIATVTAPTGKSGLVYTGSPLPLLDSQNLGGATFANPSTDPAVSNNAFVANDYAANMEFRVGTTGDWSSTIPTGTNAGEYTVYYRVEGNRNFNDKADDTYHISVTIAKAHASVTMPTGNTSLTYTGSQQNLLASNGSVTTVPANSCTLLYFVTAPDAAAPSADAAWVATPQATDAGTYWVWVKVVDNGAGNYYTEVKTDAHVVASIAKADPTLGSITVNQTDLVYDNTDKALITAAAAPTGGTISGFGYYRSDATTASPVQPDTWYAFDDFKGHDAGYYYIFIKVTGDANHNDKVFGPIDGSPKQIAKATGSVTLDSYTLHFASTDDINSTKTITATAHNGSLTSAIFCQEGSTSQIIVTESSETTFTVTRNSLLAHVGTLKVLIIVSDTNYTQVQAEVTVTMDALPPLARVTTDDIGKFVQTDGSISSTANSSSVAMIAYVGNNSDCVHGVAISLADGGQGDWSDNATTWADGHVISNTPSGSTWRLPSQNDIEKMYTACNSSSSTSLNSRLKAGSASYGFTETGGSPTWYWTSTVISNSASIFKEIGDPSRPDWAANSIDDAVNTFRYVFAF